MREIQDSEYGELLRALAVNPFDAEAREKVAVLLRKHKSTQEYYGDLYRSEYASCHRQGEYGLEVYHNFSERLREYFLSIGGNSLAANRLARFDAEGFVEMLAG